VLRPRPRQVLEQVTHVIPFAAGDVVYRPAVEGGAQAAEKIARLRAQISVADPRPAPAVSGLRANPFIEDDRFLLAQQLREVRLCW
jgi:hypothetical protein